MWCVNPACTSIVLLLLGIAAATAAEDDAWQNNWPVFLERIAAHTGEDDGLDWCQAQEFRWLVQLEPSMPVTRRRLVLAGTIFPVEGTEQSWLTLRLEDGIDVAGLEPGSYVTIEGRVLTAFVSRRTMARTELVHPQVVLRVSSMEEAAAPDEAVEIEEDVDEAVDTLPDDAAREEPEAAASRPEPRSDAGQESPRPRESQAGSDDEAPLLDVTWEQFQVIAARMETDEQFDEHIKGRRVDWVVELSDDYDRHGELRLVGSMVDAINPGRSPFRWMNVRPGIIKEDLFQGLKAGQRLRLRGRITQGRVGRFEFMGAKFETRLRCLLLVDSIDRL